MSENIPILPRVEQDAVFAFPCPDAATTSVIASIPTAYGRELVLYCRATQAVTAVIRHKAANRDIPVDVNTVLVAGTNTRIQDTGGLGEEAEILVTNASGVLATITAAVFVRG